MINSGIFERKWNWWNEVGEIQNVDKRSNAKNRQEKPIFTFLKFFSRKIFKTKHKKHQNLKINTKGMGGWSYPPRSGGSEGGEKYTHEFLTSSSYAKQRPVYVMVADSQNDSLLGVDWLNPDPVQRRFLVRALQNLNALSAGSFSRL